MLGGRDRRRQFEADHVLQGPAVEQQAAIGIVDAGAGLGRRDQRFQNGGDALRIDREIKRGIFLRPLQGVAGLQISEPFGIDGEAVGLHRGGGRDRARDDLGLHQQTLRAGIDQAGAELRQVKDARDQREQACDIQRNDAAREAREGEREQELSGAPEPAQRPLPAFQRRLFGGNIVAWPRTTKRSRRSVLDRAAFDQASADQLRKTRRLTSYPKRMAASAHPAARAPQPHPLKLP